MIGTNLKPFIKLLGLRRMTVSDLAKRVGCGRSHLTQVLQGTRRGPETRAKVVEHLTLDEIKALGWPVPELDYQI
jgi:transcriptional regulator with XRE-family HTH domain